IKRLGHTSIELTLNKHDKYLGPSQKGRILRLIDVAWDTYEHDGLIFAVFPPTIVNWFNEHFTYLDWDVRRQLDDLGKSLHRFLSSQGKRYNGEVLKISATIGYDGPSKNVRQRFRRSLERMQAIGWLTSFRFSGNGRSQPLRLHIER
ncbi:MAG: hypothetical protein AAFQ99_04670, partial [Pseudomonadota bacterium]